MKRCFFLVVLLAVSLLTAASFPSAEQAETPPLPESSESSSLPESSENSSLAQAEESSSASQPAETPAPIVEDPAENLPETDIVMTAEELSDWVKAHSKTGGTVSLGADLQWGGKLGTLYSLKPLTIDMMNYRLTVESDKLLQITGKISIVGANAPGPMLSMKSGSVSSIGDEISIRAEGPNATAVFLEENSHLQASYASFEASGEDACVIRCEGKTSLDSIHVRAFGPNAVGVDCSGNLDILASTVTSEQGDAIRCAGKATLDCSNVFPIPDGAEVIDRTVSLHLFNPFDYYAKIGSHALRDSSFEFCFSAPEKKTISIPLPRLLWIFPVSIGMCPGIML